MTFAVSPENINCECYQVEMSPVLFLIQYKCLTYQLQYVCYRYVNVGRRSSSGSQGRRSQDKTMFLVAERVLTSPMIIYMKIRRILTF
jgi:hypothetical protein